MKPGGVAKCFLTTPMMGCARGVALKEYLQILIYRFSDIMQKETKT